MSETDTAPQETSTTAEDEQTTLDYSSDTNQPPAAEQETEKTFTAADIDRIVERRLERERSKYADYEQLKADAAELAQLRETTQAELQQALERAESAEKRVTQAEFDAQRIRIAAEKGVPVSSLVGDTEEELIASADELIAWRDQNAQQKTAPPKRAAPSTSSGLKSGATGTENTNHDPKAAAAEALRRLRQSG